jgi:hypothetical protein
MYTALGFFLDGNVQEFKLQLQLQLLHVACLANASIAAGDWRIQSHLASVLRVLAIASHLAQIFASGD